MTYNCDSTLKHINKKCYKYLPLLQIEQILQKCEDPKIAKILNLEQVFFSWNASYKTQISYDYKDNGLYFCVFDTQYFKHFLPLVNMTYCVGFQ